MRRLPPTLAELQETEGGTLVRMRAESLEWASALLAGLDCPFTIVRPDDLRGSVRALADRLAACA